MNSTYNKVDRRFGAPMGRREWGELRQLPKDCKAVCLQKVRLDKGGYDKGGAYWGLGDWRNQLYIAEANFIGSDGVEYEYRRFVRAASRKQAAQILGLNLYSRLKRKVD